MSYESQGLKGWAFLVARGRRRGWRPILVPDFIADTDQSGLLIEKVSGDVSPSGPPRIVNIDIPGSGEVTIIFRTARFTSADLVDERDGVPDGRGNRVHDELVTDQHGRPLDLLFGIVTRRPVSEPNEGDLVAAKEEAMIAYRRFLADEMSFATESSPARPLRSDPAKPVLRPAPPRPDAEAESSTHPENRPSLVTPVPPRPQSTLQPTSWILPLLGVLVVAFILFRAFHHKSTRAASLAPASSLCMTVAPGGSGTCTVTVRSAGPGAVKVSSVWVDPRPLPGSWTVRPGCTGTITAEKACTITVDVSVPAVSSPGTVFTSQVVVTYGTQTRPFPLSVTVGAL
ncbi:MAG: hypothetical protein M3083_01175 [Actinomycetota bacterium]|nr:hypothetical protein [Actinomycetota bacterium]